MDVKSIPFGPATITVGEGAEAIKFDGKDYFQADGGEVSIEPTLAPISVIDFGENEIDDRVNGYAVGVTIVAAQETIETFKLAMAYADEITDATSGETVGLMDSAIGSSLRKKARKVVIHPRELPESDTSRDITVYKMAGAEGITKSYGVEQGNLSISLKAYPRDGADASKPGNYFFIGGTDPNAAV